MTAAATASERTAGHAMTIPGDLPGLLLARLTVLPALVATFFLLFGFPLLLIGEFKPVPVIAATAIAIAIGVPLTLKQVRVPIRDTPTWALVAIVVIAIGFCAYQLHHRSDFVIVTRDPASYVQFATWIAKHGKLPIPEDLSAFGGARDLVQFQSSAFFQVGNVIVPQFMAGLPMVLGTAYWWGGTSSALSMGPLLGGAAVLTFGGLAARLIGPRWAVAATLALAASFPEMLTSRSTYSEPLAQILLLGGICLFLDSERAGGDRAKQVLAAVAGLALGILLLVRLDGASDTLPILPWCGGLLLARRPQAIPLFVGFVVGTLYGFVDGVFLARPYLKLNISSVEPLALLIVVLIVGTMVTVLAVQRGFRFPRPRWLPAAAAALPPLVLAGAAARVVIAPPGITQYDYSRHALEWIIWWVGAPIVLAATAGAALLAYRVLRGRQPEWALPLAVFGWTIVVFLIRPAITPDMPWASRRLVPAVLPGCILLAAWGASWLTRQLEEHDYAGLPARLFAACCGVALVAVPAWISFQPHLGHGGLQLRGLTESNTYRGEVTAVDEMCAAIPPDSTVVVIDGPIADRLLENIRGDCGVPAARLPDVTVTKVKQVIKDIDGTGRRAVLLGSAKTEFNPYPDGTVEQVMNLHTQFDAHDLNGVPRSTRSYSIIVWMWEKDR
ncbi:hypothetical protein [Trebonia sp.]|uniref:hypothetical protein n=1 Tax=Trebonia sp. TaxID=2767075 RepID=UPI002608BC8E|nr:hypothetical protein [Trebonia sp.]